MSPTRVDIGTLTPADRLERVEAGRLQAKPFVKHLHAFRGFAILNIVGAHAWSGQVRVFGGTHPSTGVTVLNAVSESIFHDSTIYFALISGLLFSLVLQSRGWSAFFLNRLANVISPYVVMTLLFTWYGLDETGRLSAFEGSGADYLAAVSENLWTGGAFYHLWYIPILAILYLATPLIAWLLARAGTRWLVWLVMLAPLAASRTYPDFSWNTPVYFLGAYAVGMYVGMRYERSLETLRRYWKPLSMTALVTTTALVAAYLLEYDKFGPVSGRETLFYVQKLALAAVVLVSFHAHEQHLPRWLHTLATFAFSIYFLHAIVLIMLEEWQARLALGPTAARWMIATGFVFLIVSIAIAVLLSALMRRALGKRSRMLLGT
jgi:peptidoglycan/LPS O-acetylase OafA/YrhL